MSLKLPFPYYWSFPVFSNRISGFESDWLMCLPPFVDIILRYSKTLVVNETTELSVVILSATGHWTVIKLLKFNFRKCKY